MKKTRRKNGEGSVFQVSENKWVAKISLGTKPDGAIKIKQFSGKTEAIVKKKLKDFKASSDFKEKRLPAQATVRSYFSEWLREYQYNKLKPSSYDRLESTVHNHILPYIGGIKMDKLTRSDVQKLINQLYKEKHLSYSSIKKVYLALHACCQHAYIDEVITRNPCLGISLPSPEERTKRVLPLEKEEVIRLKKEVLRMTASQEPLYRYGLACLLILNTGLRMGEAISLCWEDIDFANKRLTVSKNNILVKKRDAAGQIIGGYEMQTQRSVKTKSSGRTVPINQSAELALMALKKDNPTPCVLTNNRHSKMSPSNFERSFHSILKQAGIQNSYGIHALRHTFASSLFSKGVDVKIVSRLLGHSSVKITYDTYIHLFENDVRCVTDVLD